MFAAGRRCGTVENESVSHKPASVHPSGPQRRKRLGEPLSSLRLTGRTTWCHPLSLSGFRDDIVDSALWIWEGTPSPATRTRVRRPFTPPTPCWPRPCLEPSTLHVHVAVPRRSPNRSALTYTLPRRRAWPLGSHETRCREVWSTDTPKMRQHVARARQQKADRDHNRARHASVENAHVPSPHTLEVATKATLTRQPYAWRGTRRRTQPYGSPAACPSGRSGRPR